MLVHWGHSKMFARVIDSGRKTRRPILLLYVYVYVADLVFLPTMLGRILAHSGVVGDTAV